VAHISNINLARGASHRKGGSTRRAQRTFPSEYYEDGHTCFLLLLLNGYSVGINASLLCRPTLHPVTLRPLANLLDIVHKIDDSSFSRSRNMVGPKILDGSCNLDYERRCKLYRKWRGFG